MISLISLIILLVSTRGAQQEINSYSIQKTTTQLYQAQQSSNLERERQILYFETQSPGAPFHFGLEGYTKVILYSVFEEKYRIHA